MTSNMSAIELLNLGDEGRIKPAGTKYWPHMLGVTFGVMSGVVLNFATRRPYFSGIQKHIIACVGWTTLLVLARDKRNAYLAEKDAVLRHYIELHPEDFPVPERKKLADIIEPWVPVR